MPNQSTALNTCSMMGSSSTLGELMKRRIKLANQSLNHISESTSIRYLMYTQSHTVSNERNQGITSGQKVFTDTAKALVKKCLEDPKVTGKEHATNPSNMLPSLDEDEYSMVRFIIISLTLPLNSYITSGVVFVMTETLPSSCVLGAGWGSAMWIWIRVTWGASNSPPP